ncbi:MAG: septation protein A [Gammaproteobacteria bacterium]|nr:septation protein A [Gammaproteobacteria bacterium]MCK5263276.1 septation protein A [Gammaproteobacteria bacterium]
MKLLVDFFPIILFFVSYHQANFLVENTFIGSLLDPTKSEVITATIVATGVAIVASFVQVSYHWLRTRKFEKMHLFSLALITVLGGLTIMFGNPDFVKWKPSVLNWVFAAVFFTSFFIGEKTLVERAMGNQIELPDTIWTRLNLAWIVFFIVSGLANYYVAFHYGLELDEQTRMDTWVDFKLFGLMGLTLVFIILQAIYLTRHISEEDEAIEETIEAEKHILEDK